MLLLLAQSWSAGYRQMAFHRKLGLATFVAMPLFAAGSMGVIRSMAFGTAHGDPFYPLWGAPLAGFEMMSLTGAGRAAYGALGNLPLAALLAAGLAAGGITVLVGWFAPVKRGGRLAAAI